MGRGWEVLRPPSDEGLSASVLSISLPVSYLYPFAKSYHQIGNDIWVLWVGNIMLTNQGLRENHRHCRSYYHHRQHQIQHQHPASLILSIFTSPVIVASVTYIKSRLKRGNWIMSVSDIRRTSQYNISDNRFSSHFPLIAMPKAVSRTFPFIIFFHKERGMNPRVISEIISWYKILTNPWFNQNIWIFADMNEIKGPYYEIFCLGREALV